VGSAFAVGRSSAWPSSAGWVALKLLARCADGKIIAVDFDARQAVGLDKLPQVQPTDTGQACAGLDRAIEGWVDAWHGLVIIADRCWRSSGMGCPLVVGGLSQSNSGHGPSAKAGPWLAMAAAIMLSWFRCSSS
jgi:hypothetical protein